MTVVLRTRVDPKLLGKADKIANKMGITTQDAVRIFLAQMVHRREIPFPISAANSDDDVLQSLERQKDVLESFYGDEPSYR